MGHVKALENTSCKYPIRRVEVRVDTVHRGNMNYVQDNMFLGQLPIGSVDSDATFGHEQWYILYYYYSKKKAGDALPGMSRTYFRYWRHFRSRDFMLLHSDQDLFRWHPFQ